MVTMMQHPQHGKHPATGVEIEALKASGWTICSPKAVPVAPEAAPEPSEVAQAPRTRSPNHKKA